MEAVTQGVSAMSLNIVCPRCGKPNRIKGRLERTTRPCIHCKALFVPEPGLRYQYHPVPRTHWGMLLLLFLVACLVTAAGVSLRIFESELRSFITK